MVARETQVGRETRSDADSAGAVPAVGPRTLHRHGGGLDPEAAAAPASLKIPAIPEIPAARPQGT